MQYGRRIVRIHFESSSYSVVVDAKYRENVGLCLSEIISWSAQARQADKKRLQSLPIKASFSLASIGMPNIKGSKFSRSDIDLHPRIRDYYLAWSSG